MKITDKTTKADLVAHAAQNLGVELDIKNFSRDELIAEVQKIEKSLGLVSETDQGNGGATDDGDNGNNGANINSDDTPAKKARPSFVMLCIHAPPMPSDDENSEPETHCIVGFNGKNYQIEFGVEEGVKVPYGVYDVIKNAVQTRYRRVKGKQELEARKEQRYKFTVVKFID